MFFKCDGLLEDLVVQLKEMYPQLEAFPYSDFTFTHVETLVGDPDYNTRATLQIKGCLGGQYVYYNRIVFSYDDAEDHYGKCGAVGFLHAGLKNGDVVNATDILHRYCNSNGTFPLSWEDALQTTKGDVEEFTIDQGDAQWYSLGIYFNGSNIFTDGYRVCNLSLKPQVS